MSHLGQLSTGGDLVPVQKEDELCRFDMGEGEMEGGRNLVSLSHRGVIRMAS